MNEYKVPEGKVLGLRTCQADMSSSHDFVWPKEGYVEAPDWDPIEECGNGLHALLRGLGDPSLLDWAEDAVWLAVEIDEALVVDLEGKVKFPHGQVILVGDRSTVCTFIKAAYPDLAVIGAMATAGDAGTATAGDWGTATAGDEGAILIRRWNGKRYRYEMANIGENGIEANKPYQLDREGRFVLAEEESDANH
ncbi:hypothetical protein BH10PLA2_BH10PLA2_26950 [soil metagenome]